MKLYLFYLIVFAFGFLTFGYMHESVHIEIYRSYNIDSHIEYFSHAPDLVTISDKPCPNDSCILAHNINDAIGYHLSIFYIVFGFAFLVIFGYKKMEDEK